MPLDLSGVGQEDDLKLVPPPEIPWPSSRLGLARGTVGGLQVREDGMLLAPGFDVAADFLYKLHMANQLFSKTPNPGYLFCNLVLLQGDMFTLLTF